MTDPVSFASATARHALPFLFAGQAQREFFVNQAFARIDLLLHPAVEGERNDPPVSPIPGECWLVASSPSNEWLGHAGAITVWDGDQWLFAVAAAGMTVFDKASGGQLRFDGVWQRIAPPPSPQGGTTVDVEARASIAALQDALERFGIFS